jgi:hypothetical protein
MPSTGRKEDISTSVEARQSGETIGVAAVAYYGV